MADETISQLTLIAAPGAGYSANFTSNNPTGGALGTGGAQIEVLDTTSTAMAGTGTNSRAFFGDLVKGFTAAGTNVTLTSTSGIVTIAVPATGLVVTQHTSPTTVDTEAAGAVTCNLATSDWHRVVLSANLTISLSNPTVDQQFTMVLQQAASGGPYTVTWFSGISWVGTPYTAPAMPTTASAYLTATFKCISTGVYLGWWTGNSAA
jgi:hypothetical protein